MSGFVRISGFHDPPSGTENAFVFFPSPAEGPRARIFGPVPITLGFSSGHAVKRVLRGSRCPSSTCTDRGGAWLHHGFRQLRPQPVRRSFNGVTRCAPTACRLADLQDRRQSLLDRHAALAAVRPSHGQASANPLLRRRTAARKALAERCDPSVQASTLHRPPDRSRHLAIMHRFFDDGSRERHYGPWPAATALLQVSGKSDPSSPSPP